MNNAFYETILAYMRHCMRDAAHDVEHVQRVLYSALDIARFEAADLDVLVPACLLHDIGRPAQFANPEVDHALEGGAMAYAFLRENGVGKVQAAAVRAAIESHRFRSAAPPESLEAKILFDADKLAVTGAIGVARTLLYQGKVGHPLYSTAPTGEILPGDTPGEGPSFAREYHFKLQGISGGFYTQRAAAIAAQRQALADAFYEELLRHAAHGRTEGEALLQAFLRRG